MTQNHLEEFKALLKKEITADTNIEEHFSKIANILMNKLCIVGGRTKYRVTEIEFYYQDKNIRKFYDPYTHCYPEQLENGTWYFNLMGLDITFGNKSKNIFGGILIRNIRSINENPNYYVDGVSKSLRELFRGIEIDSKHSIYIEEINNNAFNDIPFAAKRIGLPRKDENADPLNFYEKPYRFIVEVNEPSHKFIGREEVRKKFNQKVN